MKSPRRDGVQAIAKAEAAYRDGDYETAVATLAQATVDEAEYLDLAYLLGLSYARLKRFDEALLYLEQVVTQGASEARTLQCRMTLAYVYSVTGRSKLSEYELHKVAEASNETPELCSALGHATWKQGKRDEALRWYSKALELDPENLTALNGFGYLLACGGKELDKALTYCRKALDGDPGNPAYADSMGWTFLRLGKLAEAGRYLGEAAKLLSDDEELREHIAEYRKAAGGA